MNRDISAQDFDALSKEKKKQYIAELIIRSARTSSVPENDIPVAIVMAGLPGAGKTEFLDTFSELSLSRNFQPFVRIDLDQIVTVFPAYSPQSYDKFRSQGSYALARCIDVARKGRYNMMIDGTFSGSSGASLNNIEKLLESGYIVNLYYMYDDALTAWNYTISREIETKRGISKEGFLKSCEQIPGNVHECIVKFSNNPCFQARVVKQKKLRDKMYKVLHDPQDIDRIVKQGYNIDEIRKIL